MIQDTLRSQSIPPSEEIILELQDRGDDPSNQNKKIDLDNRSDDSDSEEEEKIQYGRPELQDFNPQLLSPPKYTKIKDSIKKRVKAGLYVLFWIN